MDLIVQAFCKKKYAGKYMSGNYLRPFTVEFSAGIKF